MLSVECSIEMDYKMEISVDTQQIYEQALPESIKAIQYLGGSFESGKDVFHDAMVLFMEKDDTSRAEIRDPIAFLVTVSKRIYQKKFLRRKKFQRTSDWPNRLNITDEDLYPSWSARRLLRFLEKAGEKCLNLLSTIYFSEIPMEEVADRMGYKNAHSVSVQKHKCLMQLRAIVKRKKIEYDAFEN